MQFFVSENFLVAFLSTLMASLTVIFLQFSGRYIEEKRKKLYAVTYISDISSRILMAELFLKKETILPHIEATKRILEGDSGLLDTMFLADEFDILTDNPPDFNLLPEEYKVLLGIDDIDLLQSFELVIYTSKNNSTQRSFNNFVEEKLKSQHLFGQKTVVEQRDILNIYWDYLTKIQHGSDRDIRFIIDVIVPNIERYIKGKQFFIFPKKSVEIKLSRVKDVILEYASILPDKDYLGNIANSGIQKIL